MLYNGGPLVAFNDTLGIRRTYSWLKPPATLCIKIQVEICRNILNKGIQWNIYITKLSKVDQIDSYKSLNYDFLSNLLAA